MTKSENAVLAGQGLTKEECPGTNSYGTLVDLYASDWGAGEFLAVRSVFEVADLKDYDYYRLNVLAKNGWRVWLNGTPVQSWTWYSKRKYIHYWLKKEQVDKLLKKGKNVLCVLVFKEYPGIANPKGWPDTPELGAFDCYFQGLMHSELNGTDLSTF